MIAVVRITLECDTRRGQWIVVRSKACAVRGTSIDRVVWVVEPTHDEMMTVRAAMEPGAREWHLYRDSGNPCDLCSEREELHLRLEALEHTAGMKYPAAERVEKLEETVDDLARRLGALEQSTPTLDYRRLATRLKTLEVALMEFARL